MHNKVRAKRTCTVLNCASTQYLQQFVFVRTTLSASHRWFWGFFVAIFGCANYSASWLRITAKAVNSDAIKMTNRSTNPHDDYVCCTRDENVMCLLIVLSTLLFCFFFFFNRENSMWRWKMNLCRYQFEKTRTCSSILRLTLSCIRSLCIFCSRSDHSDIRHTPVVFTFYNFCALNK